MDYANGFATHLTDEDIAKNVAAACAASGDPRETYWMLFQYVAEQNLDEIFEMLVKHFKPEFQEEFKKDFYADFEVVPDGPETFIRCNGIRREIRRWTELSAAALAWTTGWISRRREPLEELTGAKPKS